MISRKTREVFEYLKKKFGDPVIMPAQVPELRARGIDVDGLIELGLKVSEPNSDAYVLCPSAHRFFFADNVFSVCADCGGGIQHRPDIPRDLKKLCHKCAERRVKDDAQK